MSYRVSILIEAVDRASAVLSGLSRSFGQLGSRLNVLQGLITGVATALTTQLITALERAAELASECAEAYARYEWILVRVATATGAVGQEARALIGQFEELTRRVGVEFGIGATRAAEALEALVKAGLEGEEALGALEATLRLASIELMDAGEAAGYVTAILRAFGLSADQAAHVVDVLVNASIKGVGTARDFASALAFCSGIAAQLGLSLEETVAALVAMNNQGIEASYAARYLMAMLTDLIQHADELGFSIYDASGRLLDLSAIIARLSAHLAQLATDEERAAYLTRIFGARGMRAALALLKASYAGERGARALRALTEAMGEAGTATAIFEEQMGTLAGALARARARIQDAMLTVGEALAPAVEKTAALISKLAQLMAKLVAPVVIEFVEELVRGLEVLEAMASTDKDVLEGLKLVVQALALPLRILGAALLTTAGFCLAMAKAVRMASSALQALGELCETVWGALQAALSALWDLAKPILDGLTGLVLLLQDAVGQLGAAWASAWSTMGSVLEAIWSVIGPVLEAIRSAIEAVVSAIQTLLDWLRGAWEAITGFFSGLADAIKGFGDWLVGGSYWPDMLAKMGACLDRWLSIMEERFHEALSRMRDEAQELSDELVGGSIWPEMLEAMYVQAEHYLALTERLFRRWGHRLVLTAPGAPAGLLGPTTGLVGIEVNVRIERFTARGPEDIETLAREIGRHVARELRLRGVMVA